MAGKSTVNFVVGADVIENDFFVHDFHAKDNAIGVCYADGLFAAEIAGKAVKS